MRLPDIYISEVAETEDIETSLLAGIEAVDTGVQTALRLDY
jgi:hypothetical protein